MKGDTPQLHKPHAAAGVVIKRDGKYLLVQEKKVAVYGLWNIPAGRVDEGETVEEAAIREAKEETGFDVKLKRKIGVFEPKPMFPKHAFEAEIVGGTLAIPKDELLDVKWFTIEEIGALKFRSDWAPWAIKTFEKI